MAAAREHSDTIVDRRVVAGKKHKKHHHVISSTKHEQKSKKKLTSRFSRIKLPSSDMSKTELPPALRWLLVRTRQLEPDTPVCASPNNDENSDRPSPLTLVAAVKPARRHRLKMPSPKSIRVELALVLVILGPFTTDDVPTVEAFSGDCSRQVATMFRTECSGDLSRSVTVPVSVE